MGKGEMGRSVRGYNVRIVVPRPTLGMPTPLSGRGPDALFVPPSFLPPAARRPDWTVHETGDDVEAWSVVVLDRLDVASPTRDHLDQALRRRSREAMLPRPRPRPVARAELGVATMSCHAQRRSVG